ncbi:MAG: amidase, partial [Acidobacteria bacterium]|nr:amidase [Acidobacteriota bacterium]
VAAFPPTVKQRAQQVNAAPVGQGPDSDACKADATYRAAYGDAITKTMDDLKLEALVYPTWSQPPQLIGQTSQQAGDNSQTFSPTSGFPAVTVPMGYTRNNTLPIGMSVLGRAWSEATLLRLTYAYEQATRHRRAPTTTPPLPVKVPSKTSPQ